MDEKKELLIFLNLVNVFMKGNYSDNISNCILDEEVNDCLIKMYCFMMTSDDNPDHDRIYNEFLLAYHSLNDEKQKIVREDFKKIIEAQEKNEQEKIKRRGEIKYE